jgi:hypothetical protein
MMRFFNRTLVMMLMSLSCLAQSPVSPNGDLDRVVGSFPGYHLLTLEELDSGTEGVRGSALPERQS